MKCPHCGKAFTPALASNDAFELFHVIRDQYADKKGMDKIEAKNELCLRFGIYIEYRDTFKPPEWPGVFIDYHGEIYFRKSTLAYTKREMMELVDKASMALGELEVHQ